MPGVISSLKPLKAHPAGPARAVAGVSAAFSLARGGRLRFAYRISASPDALCWVQGRSPARRDELWRHTCCEAFLATGPESYLELNFSPDGSWAAYAFSSYRRRVEPDPALPPPDVRLHAAQDTLGLNADIDLGTLLNAAGTGTLRVGLAAVVEETGARTSYWALHHPGPKPDFHDARGFVLALPPSTGPTALEEPAA